MSHAATTWAWRQTTTSSGQRLVLIALADHAAANDDGHVECWPSSARLAEMTGMQPDTVQKHIESLAKAGLIEKVERRRRTNGTLGTWLIRLNVTTRTPVRVDQSDAHAVTTRTPVRLGQPDARQAHELSLENPQENPVAALPPEPSFDQWWDAFPAHWRKVDRKRCANIWKRLTPDERRAAFDGLAAWVAHWFADDNEFLTQPGTWLHQRRWETPPPPRVRSRPMTDQTIPPGYRRNRAGRVVPL